MNQRRTAGTVKKAVAALDGIVDLVGAGVVVHLPQTEADKGHVMAAVELDRWSTHAGVCSEKNRASVCCNGSEDWSRYRSCRCAFEKK